MFISYINNKKLQGKLCIESKEPEQTLEFAITFEDGIKRQKAYGAQTVDTNVATKSELLYAI